MVSTAHRRLRTREILIALATVLSLVVPSSVAFGARKGSGYYTNSATFEGVDGYIRQSGATLADCAHQAILSWIDVDLRNSSNVAWMQIGQTQGSFLGNCSPSDVRIYGESNDCTADPNSLGRGYHKVNFGHPPAPDYAVYTWNDGIQRLSPCANGLAVDYEWGMRIGSWTSSPVWYNMLRMPSGNANAQQELQYSSAVPNIGTNWWGLAPDGSVNGGYALHLYDSGTWGPWYSSAATTPLTPDPPLVRVQLRYWDAMQVHD